MGYQDRPYYRDQPGAGNSLMWLVHGSFPLFVAFGIRVRASVWMLWYAVPVLIFGFGSPGFTWQDRILNVSALFAIVLLHEFGHCFAARWVGGTADDILMHPLGGLAMAQPPKRPLPTFITVAGGPAVNLVICIICGAILYALSGWVPWNPFNFTRPLRNFAGWLDVWRYTYWIYQISWMLLCFNLLPIYPLDGGQMLQTILWPKFGYYKSTLFAATTGMVCAILGAMIALATFNIGLAILAALGFNYCLQKRRGLIAEGPYAYEDEDGGDYSAAMWSDSKIRKTARRGSGRAAKRAAKLAAREQTEQVQVDAILAKVSAHGMQSLNWRERRILHKATEHQREHDAELARHRR